MSKPLEMNFTLEKRKPKILEETLSKCPSIPLKWKNMYLDIKLPGFTRFHHWPGNFIRFQHWPGNLPHKNHDQATFCRSAPEDFYQVFAWVWSYVMMDHHHHHHDHITIITIIIIAIPSALTDCCTFPLQSRRDEWRRRVLPSPSLLSLSSSLLGWVVQEGTSVALLVIILQFVTIAIGITTITFLSSPWWES